MASCELSKQTAKNIICKNVCDTHFYSVLTGSGKSRKHLLKSMLGKVIKFEKIQKNHVIFMSEVFFHNFGFLKLNFNVIKQ